MEWNLSKKEKEQNDIILKEIVLCNLIGEIACVLAERLKTEPLLALQLFYESNTCRQLHDRSTGLYLFSAGYIAEDYIREKTR
ncbi:MAG: hypothetical protein IJK39_03675 [Bacteroidales bacterium]|jgi:hypothetical protein|nr:hypothetical protein [Bacteroidales bacterium]MBP5517711.1 hypothetical protein [Bacteroidales bacterium]MBR0314210.1 hypothetical protein [Bacteroidales bacterium]MBR6972757.1 hypothetical protein [Bacteroidales bacterium]